MLVQPVASHTGLRDGLILPEGSVVELSAGDAHQATLSVDGSLDAVIGPHDSVAVRSSPYVARFLRAQPSSAFYASLTRRLGLVYRREPRDSPE